MASSSTSPMPTLSSLTASSSSRRPRVMRDMMPRNTSTRSASISTTELSAAAASRCAISGTDCSSNVAGHDPTSLSDMAGDNTRRCTSQSSHLAVTRPATPSKIQSRPRANSGAFGGLAPTIIFWMAAGSVSHTSWFHGAGKRTCMFSPYSRTNRSVYQCNCPRSNADVMGTSDWK